MTFSLKSDGLELPRLGEVWLEVGKLAYREGETPKAARLWLIVGEVPPHRPGCPPQLRLLQLESGNQRIVNVGKLFGTGTWVWRRFASPES